MRLYTAAAMAMLALAPWQATQNPEALLAAAHRALGGEHKVAGLRSLALHGHTRVLIGSTGQLSEPRALVIRILLPDNYLRIVTDATSERRSGFAGNKLLNAHRALKPGDSFGATYGPEQIGLERAWLARFMLGLLAQKIPVIPIALRRASAASIEVTGPESFAAFLDLDETTRAPLRVRYQGPVRFPEPGSLGPPPPQQAEIVWTFQDRRDEGGLRLPHRITRTVRDITFEDMRFEKIVVNPRLAAKDFEP